MIKLPTDNLYKFISIFGLIITLNSGYYTYQYVRSIESLLTDMQLLPKITAIANKKAINKIKRIKERLSNATNDNDRVKFEAEYDKIIDENLPLDNINFDKKDIELEKLIGISFTSIFAGLIFIFGCIGGFIMMSCGFLLWYKKLQKHQDLYLEQLTSGINTIHMNKINYLKTKTRRMYNSYKNKH